MRQKRTYSSVGGVGLLCCWRWKAGIANGDLERERDRDRFTARRGGGDVDLDLLRMLREEADVVRRLGDLDRDRPRREDGSGSLCDEE